jgi:AraC-like DNA-binding protein
VGYTRPSQVSREYRRQFGLPPQRDIARLKTFPDGYVAA